MSVQNNFEKTLKEIHVMISECPKLKGEPDKVVIDKNVLFSQLNEISQCFYDMLDDFELTKQQKKEAVYQIKNQYEKTVEDAESKAQDVYSASVLYTDEAISRLTRLIESSEKSIELLYVDFEKKLRREKDAIRANQKELEDVLFEMRDNNMYLNLLGERRRQMELEQEQTGKTAPKIFSSDPIYPQPEIKINKQYFEQMGLNEDGTPKIKEEVKVETPEIKVNTNSNYFKWKKEQEAKEEKEEARNHDGE